MGKKILILFVHPRFEKSRTNQLLTRYVKRIPGLTFHDLYERYPHFNVDVEHEKQLLLEHDIVIWHHPFYWYSAPPLLKQWIDIVLGFGWAYGPGGNALEGKLIFNAITSGGPGEVYHKDGRNRFTVRQFLAPFDQTATLCKMRYLPPFAVQGTHQLSVEELKYYAKQYQQLLEILATDDFEAADMCRHNFLNEWLVSREHSLTLNQTRL